MKKIANQGGWKSPKWRCGLSKSGPTSMEFVDFPRLCVSAFDQDLRVP